MKHTLYGLIAYDGVVEKYVLYEQNDKIKIVDNFLVECGAYYAFT